MQRRAALRHGVVPTPRLGGVNPRPWLADVLARIAGHSIHSLEELLPWNWRKTADRLAA